ncbi:MAG TPA: hypothetical protein VH247_08640 [Thermoleophilaceae bacterium]|jgi:uncharacterized membrane protein YeaQ/YmgE (transglycosylase-associated protein family)|nr:hypothetical protein [Thermoleophilaceae bacterium]
MLTFIILLVITGLIVGALGRLAIPGPDPMGIGMTILVGIGGSLIAGIIGRLLFGGGGGFILAVVCSAGIVYLIRRSRERQVGGPTTPATRWR